MKTPKDYGLPYEDWRKGQRLAARTAVTTKKKHVVVQAPTGAGKSVIGALVGKMTPQYRTITMTATNALLQQYDTTFDHYAKIKGAGNYECLAANDELRKYFRMVQHDEVISCEDGPCRSGVRCSLSEDGCTYYDARRRALVSRAPLTNYAYYLAMRAYAGGLGAADRLVLDEAHNLLEQLMSAHRIDVPMHDVAKMMFSGDRRIRSSGWPTTINGWKEWAAVRYELLSTETDSDDTRVRKTRRLDMLKRLMTIDEESWAFDVERHRGMITFEPVIPRLLYPSLADDATRIVYLSATIAPSMLSLLDIPESDIETVSLPNEFPVERRPVYVVDSVRVDHKMSGDDIAWWLDRIDSYIGDRLDRKGIMPSVSRDRMQWFTENSQHRGIMIAGSGSDLTNAIEQFRRAKPPALLVSPSIEEGFDFPYTDCEYIAIPKMPFPDTRSAIMRARIKATDRYRDHLTMKRLVQASGRGMRAKDDQCEVAIFDNHARWFLWRNSDLAPQSFLDAITYTKGMRLPRPLPKLKM